MFLARGLTASLLSILLCFSAGAQIGTMPSSRPAGPVNYKLLSVNVTGSKRFTREQIAAASGLPVGTIAHEDDFKKAARQLGESGAFSAISFNYTYTGTGTKLVFQVADADKFVPARFTDFIWFTDTELLQKLHDRVPLFDGELPVTGRLADQVSDVLQALLVENAIPGHVEYLRNASKTGPIESIDYNVAGVSIRIRHLEFPGTAAGELPSLQAEAEKLFNREYSRTFVNSIIEHTLLPIFHEHGYLKAACAPPQLHVVKLSASDANDNQPPATFVDLTFPVTPGVQYKVARWDWSGNQSIPSESLQPLLRLKEGQTADTVQLDNDLQAVRDLYGSRGFVTAIIKANGELDDAAATVVYHLIVNEGPVYHMGELEFRGIDNNLTARLRAAWKIRPGDVYDANYLKEFLPLATKLLPTSVDWEVSSHVTALSREHTVDVDLQYTAKATK
jgi:outer membrane protein assembly factor BamA